MMPDPEKKRSRTEPLEPYLLMGLDYIASHPTLLGYYTDLLHHDRNSAEHTLRVTIGMIQSVTVLFKDSLPQDEFKHVIVLAALCGITHDLGKRDIKGTILRRIHVTKKHLEAIRAPHMEHLRETIRPISSDELSDNMKDEILAVIMSHHEFLANLNGRGPYPRKTVEGDTAKTIRKKPSPIVRSLQAILAFADTADRVTHGFHNTVTVDRSDAHGMMRHILDEAMYPISDTERNGILPVVTDVVFEIDTAMVTYGMQQLRVSS